MDPLDKFVQDVATANSPFDLSRKWPDIQAGIAGLGKRLAEQDARISALEHAGAAGSAKPAAAP